MSRKVKRQRTTRGIGAPSEADNLTAELHNPSSSASSTRVLPTATVPSLSTLCARVFAANFVRLRNREKVWNRIVSFLHMIPAPLIPKLLSMLCTSHPTFISHELITTYFLRGTSVSLIKDLPGVKKHTIQAIPRVNSSLQELHLTGFDTFSDDVFASAISRLPNLRILVLSECKSVASKTVETMASTCRELRVANLNYTSAPPASVGNLMMACPHLEVLKVAKISSWTDATFSKFLSGVDTGYRHTGLRTLKLRQTSLSDTSITALCEMCPNLQRLDFSFTRIRRPAIWLTSGIGLQITKLSLTSTAISNGSLLAAMASLANIQKLSLGALGVGSSANTSVSNSSAMTLTDQTLFSLSDILASHGKLESLSLVSNSKLGFSDKGKGALLHLITHVGRKCKFLNLSSITNLSSMDFSGLVPDPESDNEPAKLETLLLNNTGINDDVAEFLACCTELETLEVAGTRLTQEGLLPIVDACTNLKNLDLTSCRGVSVADRRRFFEVWQQVRRND